jgi:hypothetical protein
MLWGGGENLAFIGADLNEFIASCDAIISWTVLSRLWGQLEIGPSGDLFQ